MTNETYLTEEGLKEIKDELEYLKMTKRPEVINALKEARALGDLSENAEYDAARGEQADVEAVAYFKQYNDDDYCGGIARDVYEKEFKKYERVKKRRDELTVARHPKEIIKIPCKQKVEKWDLIRIKKY